MFAVWKNCVKKYSLYCEMAKVALFGWWKVGKKPMNLFMEKEKFNEANGIQICTWNKYLYLKKNVLGMRIGTCNKNFHRYGNFLLFGA